MSSFLWECDSEIYSFNMCRLLLLLLLFYLRKLASPGFPKQRQLDSPFYIVQSQRRQPVLLLSAYCHRSDPVGATYLKHDKMGFKDTVHWQNSWPSIKSLVNGTATWHIYILRPIRQLGHAKTREARRNSRKSRDARALEFECIFHKRD